MKKIEIISLSISIISIVVFIIILTTCIVGSLQNKKCEYTCDVYRDNIELKYQSAKSQVIDEIDKYIKQVAPNSVLNAITLFNLCEEYGVDIKFALAQGHIESHFGTKGMAFSPFLYKVKNITIPANAAYKITSTMPNAVPRSA